MESLMNLESSDRILVLRAQAGEPSAFNLLVARYRHRIMQLTMRYTRNRADAEDAAQEAFLKAFWGLRHFRGDAAFYSWLHRIAINCAKTLLSLRARHAAVFSSDTRNSDLMDETDALAAELDTPEELARTDEICSALNAALESLSEEQRTAIVLRELEGFSYSQVATAMSCPVGTVRSRVFRAREALDNQLRDVFDDGLGRERRNAKSQSWPIRELSSFVGVRP